MNAFEEERSLVRACTEGDPKAWDAFVERYSPFIDSCIRKTLARQRGSFERQEAETVYQDVFWELFKENGKALRSFSWKSKFSTYLWVIAYRTTVEHVTLCRKALGGEDALLEDQPEPALRDGDPSSVIQREEAARIVREALEDLPARDRKLLHLYYYEGKSQEEIAGLLGCTSAAVGMAILRGRRKVENTLKKTGKAAL
jgi:RNA polymerase sigma-70 factor, ECF subfamily